MAQKRYGLNNEGVHLIGAFSDYTLCGDALEGDGPNGLEEVVNVARGPVTCERCIEIIEHCRGVRTQKGGGEA